MIKDTNTISNSLWILNQNKRRNEMINLLFREQSMSLCYIEKFLLSFETYSEDNISYVI